MNFTDSSLSLSLPRAPAFGDLSLEEEFDLEAVGGRQEEPRRPREVSSGLGSPSSCGVQSDLGRRGKITFAAALPSQQLPGEYLSFNDLCGLVKPVLHPLCSVSAGKLLKSFGRNVGNPNKMRLSPAQEKGDLQLWLTLDGSSQVNFLLFFFLNCFPADSYFHFLFCQLIWVPDGKKDDGHGPELLLRFAPNSGQTPIGLSMLSDDASGRSFALVRKYQDTQGQKKTVPMHCFYLRRDTKEDLEALGDFLRKPPKLEDL